MIELTKSAEPAWFLVNQHTETTKYKAAADNNKTSPWRARQIVEALKAECSRKCMYCESVIDDVSYAAVEHIKPKSIFVDLVVEWTNLGLVCVRCNTNKGEYWTNDRRLQLLNPYEDAVDEHIDFHGPLIVAKPQSTRGENTLRKLKLQQRDDLLVSRARRIEELDARIVLWHRETDPALKSLYREDVEAAISNDREFAGVLKKFAHDSGFPA